LPLAEWEDTRATLHMWTQVAGKVRLALEPMLNHWWQVPLYVSSRGLTTSLMSHGTRALEMEFDFHEHVLEIRTSQGGLRQVRLEPRTVADFYAETMRHLDELDVPVSIMPRPVEVSIAIPFADDTTHQSYDPVSVHRFWQALVQARRVFTGFRSGYVGKASPVHFFWGGFDYACSRFSGRTAPKHRGGVPNCPDYVQYAAYSHEVSSCGYWPGGGDEGLFFAYAYPAPPGFSEWNVEPDGAYFDPAMAEFLLPYSAVRTADDPDATLLAFAQSTYDAAAELGAWDRAALEANPAAP
jgi:hypothetical protein